MEQTEYCYFQSDVLNDIPTYREFLLGYGYGSRIQTFTKLFLAAVSLFLYWLCSYSEWTLYSPMTLFWIYGLWLVCLVIPLLLNRNGGAQYKRMLISNDGRPHYNTFYFLSDSVQAVNNDNGNRNTYAYDQVRTIIETKNLLLLVMSYRLCIIVNKQSLTGGSREDFLSFLQQVCPQLRGKRPRSTAPGKIIYYASFGVIFLLTLLCLLSALRLRKLYGYTM